VLGTSDNLADLEVGDEVGRHVLAHELSPLESSPK
jgi:hypothetical protein